MRIGLDFDDTLADFRALLQVQARERFAIELGRGQRGADLVGAERWEPFIAELLEGEHTLRLAPREGALDVTRRLAERHELVVLTARHDREVVHLPAWLSKQGIRVAEIIATNRESKAPIATRLGLSVHLDDTPSVLEAFDAGHATVPALLLGGWAPPPESPPAHLRTIERWLAFEAVVEELEGARIPDLTGWTAER